MARSAGKHAARKKFWWAGAIARPAEVFDMGGSIVIKLARCERERAEQLWVCRFTVCLCGLRYKDNGHRDWLGTLTRNDLMHRQLLGITHERCNIFLRPPHEFHPARRSNGGVSMRPRAMQTAAALRQPLIAPRGRRWGHVAGVGGVAATDVTEKGTWGRRRRRGRVPVSKWTTGWVDAGWRAARGSTCRGRAV